MEELIDQIRDHFCQLQDRLACFGDQQVQVEGWFKGELLTLLTRFRDTQLIEGFDREVKTGIGNQRIDLQVSLNGQTHWIELKHWRIGIQNDVVFDAHFYFKDESSFCGDVSKLVQLPDRQNACKWMLILMTKNPGQTSWEKGIVRYRETFPANSLVPHTSPKDFPETFFIGLIRVEPL